MKLKLREGELGVAIIFVLFIIGVLFWARSYWLGTIPAQIQMLEKNGYTNVEYVKPVYGLWRKKFSADNANTLVVVQHLDGGAYKEHPYDGAALKEK